MFAFLTVMSCREEAGGEADSASSEGMLEAGIHKECSHKNSPGREGGRLAA